MLPWNDSLAVMILGNCFPISILITASAGLYACCGWPIMLTGLHALPVYARIASLCACMQDAHDGPLTSLHFFPGEPLLMSGAADNSLKQWLFDSADGTARLLRFRSGHSAPPTCLNFYGTGNKLLSAGQPSLPSLIVSHLQSSFCVHSPRPLSCSTRTSSAASCTVTEIHHTSILR